MKRDLKGEKMTSKQLENKAKRVHLFYYWTSGFISIFEGLFIIFTFGLIKISWGLRYSCYWSNRICNIKIAQVAKWVDENPNHLTQEHSISNDYTY